MQNDNDNNVNITTNNTNNNGNKDNNSLIHKNKKTRNTDELTECSVVVAIADGDAADVERIDQVAEQCTLQSEYVPLGDLVAAAHATQLVGVRVVVLLDFGARRQLLRLGAQHAVVALVAPDRLVFELGRVPARQQRARRTGCTDGVLDARDALRRRGRGKRPRALREAPRRAARPHPQSLPGPPH